MSDIVDEMWECVIREREEAADEITRLRAEVERLDLENVTLHAVNDALGEHIRMMVDNAAEVSALRAENKRLRVAMAWLDYRFVDSNTPEDELRKRIQFCLEDAARAALTGGKDE